MGKCEIVYVYIISTHYGTHYCGITNNLTRRFEEHKNGKSSYLSKILPKELVYTKAYASRKEAYNEEKRIKNYGVSKFIIKIQLENVEKSYRIVTNK